MANNRSELKHKKGTGKFKRHILTPYNNNTTAPAAAACLHHLSTTVPAQPPTCATIRACGIPCDSCQARQFSMHCFMRSAALPWMVVLTALRSPSARSLRQE